MHVISWDDEKREALKALKEVAFRENRIISLATLLEHAVEANNDGSINTLRSAKSPIPKDQTVEFLDGLKVTFSIEEQPDGLTRHVSISTSVKTALPPLIIIQFIVKALGFKATVEHCFTYLEHYESRTAVNIIEPILNITNKEQ